MRRKLQILLSATALVIVFGFVLSAGIFIWSLGHVHQHCMKNAGSAFEVYANEHGGKYPYHTNGFGDALVMLASEMPEYAHNLVGVDDDASWLRTAITNHNHVAEDICTRIYVQGLSQTNNPNIAILFDRYAVRGGDHFRGAFKPYLREVCSVGGDMLQVNLSRWPAYASNQVELLVQEGIPRKTAEAYYRPTLDPNAKR